MKKNIIAIITSLTFVPFIILVSQEAVTFENSNNICVLSIQQTYGSPIDLISDISILPRSPSGLSLYPYVKPQILHIPLQTTVVNGSSLRINSQENAELANEEDPLPILAFKTGIVKWTKVSTTGPSQRGRAAMAYDSARGKVVLFGGYYYDGIDGHTYGDTWEWDGSSWAQIIPTGDSPSPRFDHAMAYDSARGVVVLFGGRNGTHFSDTWEWDGSSWTLASTTGPSKRYCHAMAYDSTRGKVVLFGGYGFSDGGYYFWLEDTWEWNGSSWTKIIPTGDSPPERMEHAMAYDTARGKVVLFGGEKTSRYGDTWEWDGSSWTEILAPGPPERTRHAMAYDSARERVVLFGGQLSSVYGDTWEWDGSTWTQVSLNTLLYDDTWGPIGCAQHAMAYDSASGEVVLFWSYESGAYPTNTWVYGPGPCDPPRLYLCHTDGRLWSSPETGETYYSVAFSSGHETWTGSAIIYGDIIGTNYTFHIYAASSGTTDFQADLRINGQLVATDTFTADSTTYLPKGSTVIGTDPSLSGFSTVTLEIHHTGGDMGHILWGDFGEDDSYVQLPGLCLSPVITIQPQSQSISCNSSAALSVTATGTEPLSYQWYQGTSGDTSTPVGTDSDSYTTPNLISTTSYWVRVSNICSSTDSDTATITVNAPAVPSNPIPSDGATGVAVDTDLDWDDCAGADSYDVYLGTAPSPPKVATVAASTYDPGALGYNTLYYWKIVAKSACGDTAGAEWSFTTTLPPPEPEIDIQYNTTDISDGGICDFGSVEVGTYKDVTFTIENTGTADLTLSGSPIITITGADSDQFSVEQQPASPVAPGNSTIFIVRFSPTSEGAKTASISIGNNDADENPYDITLNGTGVVTTGSLTGTIEPQGARDAGAQWKRLCTVTWLDSGFTESLIPEGSVIVEFKDVAGWNRPADRIVAITAGGTANVTGTYTQLGGQGIFIDSGQSMGSGLNCVALGDLDGDSDLDAFTAHNGANKVWLNDGLGSFTDSAQSLGSANSHFVALGDVDGDGDLDAFVANSTANKVWLNDGLGNFTESGQEIGSESSAEVGLGDLDCDGDIDAYVTNPGPPDKVWLNNGSGIFTDNGQSLQGGACYGMAMGDVDGDGDLDVFIAFSGGDPNKVWLNDGSGNFINSGQSLGSSWSWDVALGDVDRDGDLDAFVANEGQPNKVWLNNGLGNFTDSGQSLGSAASRGVALGDVDGDGDLDALVANGGANRLWLNDGAGNFTDSGQSLGIGGSDGVALGDVDGDGDLDALTGKVWLNECPLPTISDQPQSQSIGCNTSAALSVTASGMEPLEYQWYLGTSGDTSTPVGTDSDSYTTPNLTAATSYWVRVSNVCGSVDSDTATITVSGPAAPSNPTPSDAATNAALGATLSWTSPDANSWDVYFGTSSPPPKVATVGTASYDPGPLNAGILYFWKIEAKNDCVGTMGPEWSFTTCSLPVAPSNPTPSDGATGVAVDTDLDWDDCAGADSYDVYFGTAPSPPKVGTVAVSTYDPGALGYNTLYYWKIVAQNACGETQGAEWSFTTTPPPPEPEINVKYDTTDIADGGIYDYGSQEVGTDTDVTFTIENTGTADLTLSGSPVITITGADSDQFSVEQQPASPVAPGNSTTFIIRFSPDSEGAKTASISIGNNDADENPYDITLNGIGVITTGSLTVTIEPQGARDAGARWRRICTVIWHESGYTESEISAGDVFVEFKDIVSWIKPAIQTVTIVSKSTASGSGAYTAVGGYGIFIGSSQSLGNADSLDVALGDIDGDGDLDAVVANNGVNKVWMNDGSGIFTDSGQSLGSEYSALALGDVDCDGDLDAFVANSTADKVWLNNGSGTFTDSGQSFGSSTSSEGVALGDVDGDGDLDAFVANYGANKVWLNNGSGTFTDSGQELGIARSLGVVLGDVDGDGDLDALVANSNWDSNKVWLNDGSGSFTDSGQSLGSAMSSGAALGDVDGDGDLDAFLAIYAAPTEPQPNRVWLNDGSGNFTDSGQSLGNAYSICAALGDVDGDGDLDAFVGNWAQANKLWLNDGSGSFTDSGQNLGSASTRSVALGDLDGDNDLDAFVANSSPNKVWMNECTSPAITAQPQGQSIGCNTSAVLSVTATGTEPLEYRWYQGTSGDTSTPVGTDSDSYTTPNLTASTSYWVRISNACGSIDSDTATITVSGPVAPSNPTPSDGATGVAVDTDLDWDDCAGADSYDVYFGTAPSPPKVGTVAVSTYDPGALGYNTLYYWKIVAQNACGETQGAEWSFTTTPPPPEPEINIKYDTTDIADEGSYDYGSQEVGTDTDVTFTIENTGTADLTLSGSPIITITGADSDQFSVEQQPASPVAPANSTMFIIRFSPTSEGAKTASISIGSNDADENPYDITFTGIGYTVPVIDSIYPSFGPVGTPVTISGSNFDTTQGEVTFDGVNSSITSWLDNEIIAQVPGGASTGPVVVHTFDGEDSNEVVFTVGDIQKILIIDLDGNNNSGPEIKDAVEANGYSTEYMTSIPPEIYSNLFPITFVCLGINSFNHVLNDSEAAVLKNYLDDGGRIYMEGGDTWAIDPPTDLHPYFGINGVEDGAGDTANINGIPGTFTQGFNFVYEGENNWMDRVEVSGTAPEAFVIWDNESPSYHNGVARDPGSYRTIGVSYEFGGIPASQQNSIMEEYLDFFILGVAALTVTSPDGGEGWELGSSQDITWTCTGISGGLNISLFKDGARVGTIAQDLDHTVGSYPWTVGQYIGGTAPASSGYTIKIKEQGAPPQDFSDAAFTLSEPPSITVTSPDGGEDWQLGSTQNITWSCTGVSGNLNISLFKDGARVGTIAQEIDHELGSYSWSVGEYIGGAAAAGTGYTIKIKEQGAPPQDFSDAAFTLSEPPSITVASPDGGEDWQLGSTQNITWSCTGVSGNLNISLFKDGARVGTIAQEIDHELGSYSWSVGEYIGGAAAAGTGYTIKIKEQGAPPQDFSDAAFTLSEPPSITVASPDGGEDWQLGSTQNITWSCTGVSGNLNISLFKDGARVGTIAQDVDHTPGSYPWTVGQFIGGTAPAGSGFTIKIKEQGAPTQDFSDAAFTLSEPPSITVTSPDGGEDWQLGSTQNITWSCTGVSGNLNISLFKDGARVGTIAQDVDHTAGSYPWTVGQYIGGTAVAGTGCTIKIKEQGASTQDFSDSGFTIKN